MSVFYHAECFKAASRLFGRSSKRFERIAGSLEHDLIVIHYQNIDRIKLHFFALSVGYGNIEDNGKCRTLALLALTFDGAFHKLDHLLRYRKAETCSLNAVDTAVHLS